jgi:hypothetical protein
VADLKTLGIALLKSTVVTMGTNQNGLKQILYTVPAGKDCIITDVIIRNPSATLAGCNDVDFGTGAACATQSFLNAETGIVDMTATTDYMHLVAVSDDYKVIDGDAAAAADREFGIYIVAGATSAAATATIAVFGFLF